jgi:hypothetical protein
VLCFFSECTISKHLMKLCFLSYVSKFLILKYFNTKYALWIYTHLCDPLYQDLLFSGV